MYTRESSASASAYSAESRIGSASAIADSKVSIACDSIFAEVCAGQPRWPREALRGHRRRP